MSLFTFARLPPFQENLHKFNAVHNSNQRSFVPYSVVMRNTLSMTSTSSISLEAFKTSASSGWNIHTGPDRTFLLNLLNNNFPDSALYTAQPTHFDYGEPIWLLILMCTMAGEPELTPAPAVYRYNGEDVVWTRRLGKKNSACGQMSSVNACEQLHEHPSCSFFSWLSLVSRAHKVSD